MFTVVDWEVQVERPKSNDPSRLGQNPWASTVHTQTPVGSESTRSVQLRSPLLPNNLTALCPLHKLRARNCFYDLLPRPGGLLQVRPRLVFPPWRAVRSGRSRTVGSSNPPRHARCSVNSSKALCSKRAGRTSSKLGRFSFNKWFK